jgi:hypothetical protein
MPTQTHPQSRVAGDIFDLVKRTIGAVEASRWMFTGNAALDGASPLEVLKCGDVDDVRRVIPKIAD